MHAYKTSPLQRYQNHVEYLDDEVVSTNYAVQNRDGQKFTKLETISSDSQSLQNRQDDHISQMLSFWE